MDVDNIPEPATEVPMKVLGLDLDFSQEFVGVPVDALVIVKCFVDGEIVHRVLSTDDLTTVECMGMVQLADVVIKNGWVTLTIVDGDDDEDEDDEPDDGDLIT